jgi:sporulation protein YlmC with PRC-barrel domain
MAGRRGPLLDGGHFRPGLRRKLTPVMSPAGPERHCFRLEPTDRSGMMTPRNRLSRSLALLLPVAMATTGITLAQRPVVLAVVDVRVVATGWRISSLLGRKVTTPEGETVGRIDDFIIGDDRILMTIISVGGFLGIGDRKVAIPYASLNMSPDRIVLPGGNREAINRLPEFHYR